MTPWGVGGPKKSKEWNVIVKKSKEWVPYGMDGKGIVVLCKNILCDKKYIFSRVTQSRDFSREFGKYSDFSRFASNSEENCEDRWWARIFFKILPQKKLVYGAHTLTLREQLL